MATDRTEGFASGWMVAQHVSLAGISNTLGQTVGHPFDLLKVRLQVQGRGQAAGAPRKYSGVFHGLGVVYREEGILGWFSGWRVSAVREFWYSGLRVGLYEPAKELIGATDKANTALWQKIVAGVMSGTVASSLSNPLDLLKVRYQAAIGDEYRKLPSPTRAFFDLARTEGLKGMWRGYIPNTSRAAGITAVQLGSYDHIKHTILNADLMSEGRPLHFVASLSASLLSIALTNPVDVVKSRMMAFNEDASMRLCLQRIVKNEGLAGLYKGSLASWLRLGPLTVVSFMSFEALRNLLALPPM